MGVSEGGLEAVAPDCPPSPLPAPWVTGSLPASSLREDGHSGDSTLGCEKPVGPDTQGHFLSVAPFPDQSGSP